MLSRSARGTIAFGLFLGAALLIAIGGLRAQPPTIDLDTVRAVVPDATAVGAFDRTPPSAPVFVADRVVAYLFRTRNVIASKGYSGKPLDVLAGVGLDGRITGAKILEHQEPILVIGVSDADLTRFVEQYRGRDIRRPIRLQRGAPIGDDTVSAVSGATISSIVLNDAILRSARVVARDRRILTGAGNTVDTDRYALATWPDLLADGSIRRLTVTIGEIRNKFAALNRRYFPDGTPPPEPGETFLDLYAGLATPAQIGRNLIGDRAYNRIMAERAPGDQFVFIGGAGLYSYKGTGYRRHGTFDRFQIVQGDRTITLRSADHIRIDRMMIAAHPELRESSLFILRKTTGFRADAPWRLDIAVRAASDDANAPPVLLSLRYELPDSYLRRGAGAATEAAVAPLWVSAWQGRTGDVAILIIALVALTGLLFFQDALVQRQRLFQIVRIGFLGFTVLWIGWYAGAQLSVLNVLTFAEAIRTEFRWDFFLLEPLVFILWGYVALTMLFWGRGVFCGWLCPFGALQELLNKIARRFRVPQLSLPFALHERLWPIKYVVFVALFGLSLGGLAMVQIVAEVEPFKTAIVLRFDRALAFVLYALILLGVGLFVERFFCRYLCPLGAALAFPARMRMFEWLKRRWQCGLQCHICARSCPVQAIHPEGRINPNECIHCLNCQVLYYDDTTCPPLAERRKSRKPQLTDRLIKRFSDAETKGRQQPEEKGTNG